MLHVFKQRLSLAINMTAAGEAIVSQEQYSKENREILALTALRFMYSP